VVGWCAGALGPSLVFAGAMVLPLMPGPSVGAVLPVGLGSLWPLVMLTYLALGGASAVGAFLVSGAARRSRIGLSLMLLSGFALSVCLVRPTLHARMRLAAKVPARAAPVVEALERFRRDRGRYPVMLSTLVPDYLPRLPRTGLLGSPGFRYTRADPEDDYGYGAWLARQGAGYDLSISCPVGFGNFDSMHYWPSGKYPTTAWGGVTERVDGWVYVHE
jgi:hypothetical protein